MRISPLFLAVLLLATAADFAVMAGDAAADVAGAVRAGRRDARRTQRAEQVQQLRERHQSRLRASAAANSDLRAAVMPRCPVDETFAPGEETTFEGNVSAEACLYVEGDVEPVEPTDCPEKKPVADYEDDPRYLGPPIRILPICELHPDGHEPQDDYTDPSDDYNPPADDSMDDDVADDSEYDQPEILYTLNGAANGGFAFRGNSDENHPGNSFGNANEIRGAAAVTAASHTSGGNNFDPERAQRLLAHRLAQIDRLRDKAVDTGNNVLLEQADHLEAIARAQFEARSTTTVSGSTDADAEDEAPATPAEEPAAPAEEPAAPSEEPAAPSEEPVASDAASGS